MIHASDSSNMSNTYAIVSQHGFYTDFLCSHVRIQWLSCAMGVSSITRQLSKEKSPSVPETCFPDIQYQQDAASSNKSLPRPLSPTRSLRIL